MSKEAMKLALEALTHGGCPPDCKDGMTDSGGVHPWGEAALIPCPNCQAITALREALAEQKSGIKQVIELYDSPDQPAQQDIPDLIAGALGVSRGTAYDMMREALADAQPQQEPVATVRTWHKNGDQHAELDDWGLAIALLPDGTHNLYTSPPAQRTWVGLTDEEVMVAAYQAGFDIHEDYENEDDPEAMHWWTPDGEACDDSLLKLRDLIEAKLKEKNA